MVKLCVLLQAVAFVAMVTIVQSDVYLHGPRGSNNRLNEKSAARSNGNRLFDSQNNARGGYNVGDATNKAAVNELQQYQMKYFQSGPKYKVLEEDLGDSQLVIEWTNQHGCGGNEDTDPHKQNCHIVLQYMCHEDGPNAAGWGSPGDRIRDGLNTNTQNYNPPNNKNENEAQRNIRRAKNVDSNRGEHEPWVWYDNCYVRERNQGLFTADQQLNNNKLGYSSAIYTRQNPNGNRRGYECPEERDYYPYFHPSPWKDIAILAENATMCPYFEKHSFNVASKYECVELWPSKNRKYSRWNNEEDCSDNDGKWTELFNYLEIDAGKNQNNCEESSEDGIIYKWALPYDTNDGKTKKCLVMLDKPECKEAPWSRSNHHGNGREGVPNNYTWTLPYFPSGKPQRCVLRLRYNISTDDYDPYNTDASFNRDKETGVKSPVEQNPYVELGYNYPLRLAINTAQFGRTFQDRTHAFLLRPRPGGTNEARIYNLNVRGKRGNIVQTYPAVEYDFIPNNLRLVGQDLVHIQWTGSNTHNNGNPAGDGQAGDAGEGTGGTDRNNIVQSLGLGENYPVPFENSTMWTNTEILWIHHGKTNLEAVDLAVNIASSGYYHCMTGCGSASADIKANLNNLLNNAPASYEGVLLRFKKGKYHYICSRNNNFTNRSQKGTIIVL